MNPLLIPTVLIAVGIFCLGVRLSQRTQTTISRNISLLVAALLAAPGIAFAVYYLKVFREPIWLYEFRTIPFTEMTAGGAGLLAGLLHGWLAPKPAFRRVAGSWFFPGILLIGILVPYLKPIVRPPRWNEFQDRWSDGVCLQTSESSCGPACAATLLKRLGKTAREKEIARAAFTSRNGTECWYLARALQQHGVSPRFVFNSDSDKPWPIPAIAGVRLPSVGNTGHFIVVLERQGDEYVIGDPLEGKSVGSPAQLRESYEFTGFFLVVE